MERSILKKCPKCGNYKPKEEYYYNKSTSDGFDTYCKVCSKEKTIRWQKNNPNKVKDINKNWNKNNREKIRADVIKRRRENLERYRLVNKKANQKRRGTLHGRISANISGSIYGSLKKNKASRHWETLVGYTINQLKRHIEKQFLSGMNWDNYGPIWHIDHIIPIAAFNFNSSEDIDFKRCWELKNLRPLWAKDNLKKNKKLIENFQPSFSFFNDQF